MINPSTSGKQILFYGTLIFVSIYFLISGLVKASTFLIPLTTAAVLALLLVPLVQRLEKWFFNRAAASITGTILVLLLSIGFLFLVSTQIKTVADDWPKIKETMKPKIAQAKEFLIENTPLNQDDLKTDGNENSLPWVRGTGSNLGKKATNFVNDATGFLGNYLLVFIYIFFLLNYRHRFKVFLLKLFSENKRQKVTTVLTKSAKVTQKYLLGKLILIGLLSVVYSIGLGVSGVNNFILISIIAAILTIIPYIGNVVGFGLAMIFGYLVSGETAVLIGIILTFTIAQFVESYILQPYIVGDQVDLHPFFVILSVVIGGMIWGIMGMILAIPLLAIINVIFTHISPLKPFGFLLSKDDE